MLFTVFCRISNILKNHAFWQTIRIWFEDNFTFLGPCLQGGQRHAPGPHGGQHHAPAPYGGLHHHALAPSGAFDGPPRLPAVHRPATSTTPYGRHHALAPYGSHLHTPASLRDHNHTLHPRESSLLLVCPVGQTCDERLYTGIVNQAS